MWPQLLLLVSLDALAATVPGDYPTLVQAVAAVPPGTTIELGPGTWIGSLDISKNLEIVAAGHPSQTIIEGSLGVATVDVSGGAFVTIRGVTLRGNSNRALVARGGSSVVVEDAECTNGVNVITRYGGCMRASNSSALTVRRTRFYANDASDGAHVGVVSGSTVRLEASDLRSGAAAENGGAVAVSEDGSLVVVDSRFSDNAAVYGGAIHADEGADVSIAGSWFYDHLAGIGGAVYFRDGGELEVIDSIFAYNQAYLSGGAVRLFSTSDAQIARSVFAGNVSGDEGSGIGLLQCVDCITEDSWFYGNEGTNTGELGGAVAMTGSSTRSAVLSSLFVGNSTQYRGGGVGVNGSSGTSVQGSYFCDNYARERGGAVHIDSATNFVLNRSVLIFNRGVDRGGAFRTNSATGASATHNTFLANISARGTEIESRGANFAAHHNVFAWSAGIAYYRDNNTVTSAWDWYFGNTTDTDGVGVTNKRGGVDPLFNLFNPAASNCSVYDLRPGPTSTLIGAGQSGATPGAFANQAGDPRWYEDLDGDGFVGLVDCNDGDPDLRPNTVWYRDLDGDGFGDPDETHVACYPPDVDWVLDGTDCDDTDPTAFFEVTVYADADGDGYGDPATAEQICGSGIPAGRVTNGDDCDDTDPQAFPGQTWYTDGDGDGFGADATLVVQCERPTSGVVVGGDCDDTNAAVYPGAVEVCNGIDDSCNGLIDDADPLLDLSTALVWYADVDGDGLGDPGAEDRACNQPVGFVANADDCDDSDAAIGLPLQWWPDGDGDGYGDQGAAPILDCPPRPGFVNNGDDCDDTDPAVHPDTIWYADTDGDGFGDDATAAVQCEQLPGHVLIGGDCDPTNAAVYPGATEVCNGIDDSCNGLIDDADPALDLASAPVWYADADGDGFGDPAVSLSACLAPGGYVADNTDCDDTNPLIHPDAPEQCDEIDHNCNGVVDDDVVDIPWYLDNDGDGYGQTASSVLDCAQPDGYAFFPGDCDDGNPSVNPGMLEVCNGIDDNCDGQIDVGAVDATIWAPDADGDGHGDSALAEALCEQPAGWVALFDDCDDTDATVYPGATEVCDGKDTDCNGLVDDVADGEGDEWFVDADGDGWGDAAGDSLLACSPPDGYGPPGDCDDADPGVHPDAPEVCNGIDDNCSGVADDGLAITTWYLDADGDGYGDPDTSVDDCGPPPGYVADNTDCDDTNAAVYPNAPGLDAACLPLGGDGGRPLEPGDAPIERGEGCGCDATGPGTGSLAWLVGLVLLARRRRAAA